MSFKERLVQMLLVAVFGGMFLIGAYMMITRPVPKLNRPSEPEASSVVEKLPEASSTAEPQESSSEQPQDIQPKPIYSIMAYTTQESYPVGTQEITLVVTNRADGELMYTDWFDFRRVTQEGLEPLSPREGEMVNPEDPDAAKLLAAGETVTITVPIDIFEPPLTAGTYRVAQLACFVDTKGQALACTEIAADFILTAE
ncbi:MAG: hypothetical protein HFG20_03350 [Anaerotruncus sp.]|nr:hypothetical protein [Anaerotruncus sp.]